MRNFSLIRLTLLSLPLILAACGSGSTSHDKPASADSGKPSTSTSSSGGSGSGTGAIRVNQIAFAPAASKIAVVVDAQTTAFSVLNADTGAEVFTGQLSEPAVWPLSGESVRQADFSSLSQPGHYRVQVQGLPDSPSFAIADAPYAALNSAAIKAFYFNRASTALPVEYAGDWARDRGHPDDAVRVHESAASPERPAGSELPAPKGWYDAGDYGKYIVNSGIATYTLLAALEHFPDYYAGKDVNIPESGDDIPDLLDEALWNLEWMLAMQDSDGSVYHKLTTRDFVGIVMPAEAPGTRYVIGKGTAATLDFAAVMAAASRQLNRYPVYQGLAEDMLTAAEAAWNWARENPDVAFTNPADVSTGEYGDGNFEDEFAWAAAELYITTGDDAYYTALDAENADIDVPSWPHVAGLAWMSLAHHRDALTPAADKELIQRRIVSLADYILAEHRESAYGVSMRSYDFVWGSNSTALNRAIMLLQAHRLTGSPEYLNAAQALLDYVLGRNATGYSFVTGFGERTPQHIHHRPSAADGLAAPVPGFLAGGPHAGQQDECGYPSNLPAKSYLDHWCSYSTNEVAINWNAPLVYVTGALDVLLGN